MANPLIPQHLIDEMREQDESRERARRTASPENFRNNFINKHALEIELIRRGAIVKDVDPFTGQVLSVELPEPAVVVYASIWKEHVMRYWGNFCRWFQWKNVHINVNEGGRGITFAMMPHYRIDFRLYIAGWVLMRNCEKWSLRDRRSR